DEQSIEQLQVLVIPEDALVDQPLVLRARPATGPGRLVDRHAFTIAPRIRSNQCEEMDTRARTGYSPDVPRIDIAVPGIPQPLASYTAATRAGDLVFAAGHLASDFKQGVAPEARLDPAFPFYGSSIKKQTRYVLENLARTFEAAGSSLSHVVKAQVFLTDLAHFSGFDEVWREFFPTPPPR